MNGNGLDRGGFPRLAQTIAPAGRRTREDEANRLQTQTLETVSHSERRACGWRSLRWGIGGGTEGSRHGGLRLRIVSGRVLAAVIVSVMLAACDSPLALEPTGLVPSSPGEALKLVDVRVTPAEVTLEPGQTAQLSATLIPPGRWRNTDLLWRSTNPAVATVSAAGLVTAIAEGTATILASVVGESGSSQVTVTGGSSETPPPPPPSETVIPGEGDWSDAVHVLPSGQGTWPDGGGDWDYILWGASTPVAVARYNGTWYLYYIGSASYNEAEDTPEWRAIGVATSTDGMNFVKHPSNPIVEYTPTPQFEEGVFSVALLTPDQSGDGKWHMWYGGIVSIGGSSVDMTIRHRDSNDGIVWENDTLVKSQSEHEYMPIAAYYADGVYSVFYLHIDGTGGGGSGAGPLRRLYGSSPTSPRTDELVTSTHFAKGDFARDAAGRLIWQFHVSNASPGQYEWRVMEATALNVLSDPVHAFTMPGYYASSVHYDPVTGVWRWYQLYIEDPEALTEVRVRTAGG